jgi:hypothetical protein
MMDFKDLFNAKKIQAMDTEIKEMKTQHLQLLDDILTARQTSSKRYKGNKYKTYKSAVQEIISKYQGTADWGVLQTGSIIDMRAAFILSQGVKIVEKKPDAERERIWSEEFLRFNNLDNEVAQQFGIEAEIEGKFLGKLSLEDCDESYDEHEKMASVRFVSFSKRQYKIETKENDYAHYIGASWKEKNTGSMKWTAEDLKEKEFVYIKFGGRIDEPNNAQPKIMKCLTQVEDLDKALRDLREINRLFAAPTPYFKCETKEEVTKIMDEIKNNPNFKVKKMIASTAEFSFVQPDVSGVENLISEILTLVKMISGTTGVPIHFLGLLDLLKNRATGENTREMVTAATTKERESWIGAYEEMLTKGMNLYNEEVHDQLSKSVKLDPSKIGVELPIITEEQWLHLEKVLLPANLAGKISDEYFLSQIPGLNVREEQERKKKKQDEKVDELENDKRDLEDEIKFRDMNQLQGTTSPSGSQSS